MTYLTKTMKPHRIITVNNMSLEKKSILITGAARRLGKAIALAVAEQGANVVLHYHTSSAEVEETADAIRNLNRSVWIIKADLEDSSSVQFLIEKAQSITPLFALVNNASIFGNHRFQDTSLEEWNRHLQVNLTAPFLLTQKFATSYSLSETGRVINMLDWRALRPGKDHFPYTISKAALAALTRSTALILAPRICVNAVALGAILPPENESPNPDLLKAVPLNRWATLDELTRAIIFLLDGPDYITGEIIHLDGGRHLI